MPESLVEVVVVGERTRPCLSPGIRRPEGFTGDSLQAHSSSNDGLSFPESMVFTGTDRTVLSTDPYGFLRVSYF